jgi:hypothetical protein
VEENTEIVYQIRRVLVLLSLLGMKGCRSESGAVDSVEGSTGVLDTSF